MNDSDKQLAFYLAVKGKSWLRQSKHAGRIPSKRAMKNHAKGPRRDRSKTFKWFMNTTGEKIPLRHKFGLP